MCLHQSLYINEIFLKIKIKIITLEIHKKSTNIIKCNINTYKCSHVYGKLVEISEGLKLVNLVEK